MPATHRDPGKGPATDSRSSSSFRAVEYPLRHKTEVIVPSVDSDQGSCPHKRRRFMQTLWMAMDVVALLAVALVASWVLSRYPSPAAWGLIALMTAARIITFIRVGMYRAVLRYSGIHTMWCALWGIAIGSAVALAAATMFDMHVSAGLGRAFWVLEGFMAMTVACGMRLSARMVIERRVNGQVTGRSQRVLIYGAGGLGELALRDLQRAPGYQPIGFIDDNPAVHRRVIHGKTVLGGLPDLDGIIARVRPDLIVVAMSDPPPQTTRRIFKQGMARGIHVLLAKGVSCALDEDSGSKLGLRDLALEDLLRRPSRQLDERPVREMISGKAVLITGAGGSIGSELCRQVARMGAHSLHILDHSELNLYQIHGELQESFPKLTLVPHLLSLCDGAAVDGVLQNYPVQLVIHAAAYKHVPLVEANPFQGLRNNVLGFRNLLTSADAHGVESLVLISTDKAVRPTNLMGASKRVCEIMMQALVSRQTTPMRCCAVRFGNVLGSSGSVVPRFLAQIQNGGPVTVTDPEITRYFMLIPEAVSLVLQASARSTSTAEIFILDMGEPVKIAELARQLIFMHGRRPDEDIKIVFTGLRPGEKLYEELLLDESSGHTDIPDITVGAPLRRDPEVIQRQIEVLLGACAERDYQALYQALLHLVPEWKASVAFLQSAGLSASVQDGKILTMNPKQGARLPSAGNAIRASANSGA